MTNLFSIEGKVVVVTGGGRGIGRTIAQAMAEHQAITYCLDIRFDQDVPPELTRYMFHIECDITDEDSVRRACSEIYDRHQRSDVLVNNAGITRPSEPESYPLGSWEETLAVNLTGAFVCSRVVAEYMKKGGGGSIINITSLNAEIAFPNNPAYIASKGGLKMLGKSLALDWGEYGIRVNNIGPGYIRTEMTGKSYENEGLRKEREARTMLGRWGTPEDLIGLCIFLASDASSYITGQDIYVDGGWLSKGL